MMETQTTTPKLVEAFRPLKGVLPPMWYLNAVKREEVSVFGGGHIELSTGEKLLPSDWLVRLPDDKIARVSAADFAAHYEVLPATKWTYVEPHPDVSLFLLLFCRPQNNP